MRLKADRLSIQNKVYSINAFITKCTTENPELLNYEALSVRKTTFGEVIFRIIFLIHSGNHMHNLIAGLLENVIKTLISVRKMITKYRVFYI